MYFTVTTPYFIALIAFSFFRDFPMFSPCSCLANVVLSYLQHILVCSKAQRFQVLVVWISPFNNLGFPSTSVGTAPFSLVEAVSVNGPAMLFPLSQPRPSTCLKACDFFSGILQVPSSQSQYPDTVMTNNVTLRLLLFAGTVDTNASCNMGSGINKALERQVKGCWGRGVVWTLWEMAA